MKTLIAILVLSLVVSCAQPVKVIDAACTGSHSGTALSYNLTVFDDDASAGQCSVGGSAPGYFSYIFKVDAEKYSYRCPSGSWTFKRDADGGYRAYNADGLTVVDMSCTNSGTGE